MKFGYVLPNFGGRITADQLLELATLCEGEGFDSVWATDHILVPQELREPYGELLEPLVTLSFVAAHTDRIRLGTSVIVLPQRNPMLVAKQAAALDVFSKGRLTLGVGAGWSETEFSFLGADFGRRGRVFDESLRLMRALWTQESVTFEGRFFRVKDAIFLPKPVRGSIPLWIGGASPSAVARALRLGDGWHPTGCDLATFAAGAERIRSSGRKLTISLRLGTDARKKRDAVVSPSGERRAVLSGSADEIRQELSLYEEAGLEYFCCSVLRPSAEEIASDLRKFAAEVVRSY